MIGLCLLQGAWSGFNQSDPLLSHVHLKWLLDGNHDARNYETKWCVTTWVLTLSYGKYYSFFLEVSKKTEKPIKLRKKKTEKTEPWKKTD